MHTLTFDGGVFPYKETLIECDEEGKYDYIYDISGVWGKQVSVSRWWVSLWHDGGVQMTNLEPHRMFPHKQKLSVTDLQRIIKTLSDIGLEGMPVSKEEMESFHRRYLREMADD